MQQDEIVVVVADNGIFYDRIEEFDPSLTQYLYVNSGEIPENGIDDDGNGFVDDVTGPDTGPASNNYYYRAAEDQWHGTAMVYEIIDQAQYVEAALGMTSKLNLSIMPTYFYLGDVLLEAVQQGARVISYSGVLPYNAREILSEMVSGYDVIIVSGDRDNPTYPGSGDAGINFTDYDNYLEVGLISTATVRGNVYVDLLSEGQRPDVQTESVVVSKTAGKIAAVWAINPALTAAEVVDLIAQSTSMDNPIIQQQGLSSEMGGEIDFDAAIALALASLNPQDAGEDEALLGTSGNDALDGQGGDDTIEGDLGNDTLDGGTGNDQIYGELSGTTLYRGGNDVLNGNAGQDSLFGGTGDDTMDGGADADFLDGNSGNDVAFGGAGNDTIEMGAGADTVDGGDDDDLIRGGSKDDLLMGGLGNDTLLGEADNDTVYGNEGDDRVNGNTGNDSLIGGVGDDTLWGQAGSDTLDGGAGSDVFKLGSAADTLIFDFNAANDGDVDLVRDMDFSEDTLILRAFNGNSETVVSSVAQLYSLGLAGLTVSENPDGTRTEMVFDDGSTTATVRLFDVTDPFILG